MSYYSLKVKELHRARWRNTVSPREMHEEITLLPQFLDTLTLSVVCENGGSHIRK